MIELITARDWVETPSLRDEIFEFRHRVFIKNLAWKIPSCDGLEFDEFDALLPHYFTSRTSNGRLKALCRLLPTTGPYMLKHRFRRLFGKRTPPKNNFTWELSRLAFDAPVQDLERLEDFHHTAGLMFCALGEFGIENGIKEIIAVFDSRILPILRSLNCRPIWMGEPENMGDLIAVAAGFQVSESQLSAIREKVSLTDPILVPHHTKRRAA